jgi:DNA repair exonuclease SbcCD ATPase subunit
MRSIPLHRDDVRFLRDELSQLRTPHLAAQEQKAKQLEEAEKEKIRVKREMVVSLKDRIATLCKQGETMELEPLAAAFEEIQSQLATLEVSKMEKQQIERTLRPLKDLVADKKEQSLVNLSEDDKKTLENLRVVLQQRKERRQEIKNQLETYRKVLGGSNLDFEKAMQYRELVEQEKERLEKASAGIQEIEQKIEDLES